MKNNEKNIRIKVNPASITYVYMMLKNNGFENFMIDADENNLYLEISSDKKNEDESIFPINGTDAEPIKKIIDLDNKGDINSITQVLIKKMRDNMEELGLKNNDIITEDGDIDSDLIAQLIYNPKSISENKEIDIDYINKLITEVDATREFENGVDDVESSTSLYDRIKKKK